MASKTIIICVAAFAVFDVISAQCIKNLLPGCGCGGVDVLYNQGLLAQPGVFAQPGLVANGLVGGGVINGLASNVISPVVGQYGVPTTNIIQDNTVATNLANTLQLLLVSNLLSNTLPNSPDVLLPAPACSVSPYASGLSYYC